MTARIVGTTIVASLLFLSALPTQARQASPAGGALPETCTRGTLTAQPSSLTVAIDKTSDPIAVLDTSKLGSTYTNNGAGFSATLSDNTLGTVAKAAGVTNENGDTANITIAGLRLGTTTLTITHGTDCIQIPITVKLQFPRNRLVLAAGFLASRLQNQTFTTVTPAPAATPSNGVPVGTYVFANENSSSQVSIPLFAHYQLTDFKSPFNLFGSIGYSATSKQGVVYGLTYGMDQQAFVTIGLHSQTINLLCPNVNASTGLVYTPGTAIAAPAGSGAPTLCAVRTAKLAFGATFPISTFTTFIGNLTKIGS